MSILGLQQIPFEHRHVTIESNTLSVKIELGEETWEKSFQLFDTVNVEQSKFVNKPVKIEIQLEKVRELDWPSLEKVEVVNEAELKPASIFSEKPFDPRKYPTSKKTDFDALSQEAKKMEEEDKPDGDAALNKLFQQIYSQGTPETRRAMIKSFTESGGTVLSTNWDEIGKDKVKGEAPNGMQMHKWDD